jgi:hypothetical protein
MVTEDRSSRKYSVQPIKVRRKEVKDLQRGHLHFFLKIISITHAPAKTVDPMKNDILFAISVRVYLYVKWAKRQFCHINSSSISNSEQ